MPFALPTACVYKRAPFATKHLWVPPYDPAERSPAGDSPNQHPGGAGLPVWTPANRSLENTNLVLWETVGVHPIPRTEEWPVMPVTSSGLTLKPVVFCSQSGAGCPPAGTEKVSKKNASFTPF